VTPYYEHAGITIYHGDCREILPTLPKVDCIVTDPPYGTEELAGGYGRRQLHDVGDGKGRVIQGDTDLTLVRAAYAWAHAHLRDAWSLWFFAPRRTPEFINATSHSAWFGEIVWNKRVPGLGYHVRYSHESIAIFKHGEPARPGCPLLSVLDGYRCPDEHPHAKPIAVMGALVEWACPIAGVVLDPFMGVGSTLIAAKTRHRQALGIEIEERYCEVAALRLAQDNLFAEQTP